MGQSPTATWISGEWQWLALAVRYGEKVAMAGFGDYGATMALNSEIYLLDLKSYSERDLSFRSLRLIF